MDEPIKRTPSQWEAILRQAIKNDDGWRDGVPGYPGAKSFDEPITLHEFRARAAVSTVGPYEGPQALLPPAEWETLFGVKVKEPDGWRHGVAGYPEPKDWAEPITRREFSARLTVSTVDHSESERFQPDGV